METFEALLICSIRRYEEILTLFEAINNEGGDKNPSTLDSTGTKILQLQEKAALADQELISVITKIDSTASTHLTAHSLLEQRQDLMQRILGHNKSLLSTINNIKSLLAHEIKEMHGGRIALKGYSQTNSSQHGGIVNESR